METLKKIATSPLTKIGALAGIVLWASLALGMAKIDSPRTGERVSRPELVREVIQTEAELKARQLAINHSQEQLNADIEKYTDVYGAAFTDLDAAEQRVNAWLGFGTQLITAWAAGDPVTTSQAVGGLFSLLGIGAAAGATAKTATMGGGLIRDKIKQKQDGQA